VKTLIGTGGWQYFPLAKAQRLKAYSRLFGFVEVNSTFYTNPPIGLVRRWRESVPQDFEFSVKVSREITYKAGFEQSDPFHRRLEYTAKVCDILRSNLVVVETPSSFRLDEAPVSWVETMVDFFEGLGLTVAWEHRGELDAKVVSIMKGMNIVHSVDLSRTSPAYDSPILYSRVFGRGEHTLYRFTERDFDEIERRAEAARPKKAYIIFHGVAMYADALRFMKRVGQHAQVA